LKAETLPTCLPAFLPVVNVLLSFTISCYYRAAQGWGYLTELYGCLWWRLRSWCATVSSTKSTFMLNTAKA